jgi:hypothetical protein
VSATVPWLPWLEPGEHVPGEVVLILQIILVISCTRRMLTGSALLRELSARVDMGEEELIFYVHLAMELGILGGIDIATGAEVTVEHVSAAEMAALDPSVN